MIKIEVYYFTDCPSWQEGLHNLQEALQAEGLEGEVELVKISDPQQAQRERFLGSPSFRIGGKDLWPEERARYTLACRVYATPQGMRGSPTIEMLREKIRSLRLTGDAAKA